MQKTKNIEYYVISVINEVNKSVYVYTEVFIT